MYYLKRDGLFTSSMSKMIKSARNMNLSTFPKISSTISLRYLINLAVGYNITIVAFAFPKPSLLRRDKYIKLTLAPKSHNAFCMRLLPMLTRNSKTS